MIQTQSDINHSTIRQTKIDREAINKILGFKGTIALEIEEMTRPLQATILPHIKMSSRLRAFTDKLCSAFTMLGVDILEFEQAVNQGANGKVKEGVVIIIPGEVSDANLASNYVSSLYNTPVVGIYDGPCPAYNSQSTQEKLDALVGVIAWNMVHIAVFVEESNWTIGTMNGSIVSNPIKADISQDVAYSLIPKLTAQVVPPNKSNRIFIQPAGFSHSADTYQEYFNDFVGCGKIWAGNKLMLSHTSVVSLNYRNNFCKRIVRAFLDNRSGMSYGFMVRQLPVDVKPAIPAAKGHPVLERMNASGRHFSVVDGILFIRILFMGREYLLEVPDVWVLSTRSGCNKTRLNPQRDIVRMGLCGGKVIFQTPHTAHRNRECNPSYDTLTILAHAVGNALAAGLLLTLKPHSIFAAALMAQGVSLTHWHGYLDHRQAPYGHYLHGMENLPVSCSTPQSAIYALMGKMDALQMALADGGNFLGDIHTEPHHGTNLTSIMTLTEAADWIDANHQKKAFSSKVA